VADLSFVDAAFPTGIPSNIHFDGVCFYTGGDAYHVWSVAELDGRHETYRLPIWVRSDPGSVNPTDDANSCVASLRAYGVPTGALVALDSETSIDAAWTRTFVDTVNGQHHPVIDYGSQSDVMSNKNPDGYYWGADWTSVPHLHAGDQMTQYVSYSGYDESLAESTLPFWKIGATVTFPFDQKNWRWCHKCQGLFYGPNEAESHCPAGGTHDGSQSGDYEITDTAAH